MEAMKTNILDHGLYFFPGLNIPPNATMAQKSQAMEARMKKVAGGPSGILVYHPSWDFSFGKALATELSTNIVQMLLAVFLLGLTSLTGFMARWRFLAVVGLVAAFVVVTKSGYLNEWYSRAHAGMIFLPLLGKLTLYLELSRFSYSMFSMLNSGIEFIKALRLSAGLIQNKYLREAIEAAMAQIREGKKIAAVFGQISLLPPIVANMIVVGEGSGNLKEIFFEIHQMFDERFKNTVKRVLILVEPAIITLMGLIVGFIVLSLILTVMSASNIKL